MASVLMQTVVAGFAFRHVMQVSPQSTARSKLSSKVSMQFHDQERFRGKSSYLTSLNVWSSPQSGPAPGKPPAPSTEKRPPRATHDANFMPTAPVSADSEHEVFRDRHSVRTSLNCWSSPQPGQPRRPTSQQAMPSQSAPQRPVPQRSAPQRSAPQRPRTQSAGGTQLQSRRSSSTPASQRYASSQSSTPPIFEASAKILAELAEWMQTAINLPAADATTCAQLLYEDGCRCVGDIELLAEVDELPTQIPKAMRLKLKRVCGVAQRA